MELQRLLGKVWRLRRETGASATAAHGGSTHAEDLHRELVRTDNAAVASPAASDEQAGDAHIGYLG